MWKRRFLLLGLGALLLGYCAADDSLAWPGQDGPYFPQKPKGKKLPPSEDEKILKGLEKALKPGPTEREKLLKDLYKMAPFGFEAAPAGQGGRGAEFNQWFDVLTGGSGVWVYDDIAHKPLRDLFERMAGRLGANNGRITRQQFLRYAQQYLTEEAATPWNAPGMVGTANEAEKTFRDLDRNGDGVLGFDEMSEVLRGERSRWDANRDGFVDLDEYKAYFLGRVQQMYTEAVGRAGLPNLGVRSNQANGPLRPAARTPEPGDRPVVYRPGHLPEGLPSWFSQLDTDRDGQVGFYEWRAGGRSSAEFERLDANNDGFLTAEELLRLLAQAQEASREKLDYPLGYGGRTLDSALLSTWPEQPGGKGPKPDKKEKGKGMGPKPDKKDKQPKPKKPK